MSDNMKKQWGKNEIKMAKEKYEDLIPSYEAAAEAFDAVCDIYEKHPDLYEPKTNELLLRLLNGFPLTPITDDPSEWIFECGFDPSSNCETAGYTIYKAVRRPSLLKKVTYDGDKTCVEYMDTDRGERIDIDTNKRIDPGFVGIWLDIMFPIAMPYFPYAKIKVFTSSVVFGDDEYVSIPYVRAMDGSMHPMMKTYLISHKDDNIEIHEIPAQKFGAMKKAKEDKKNTNLGKQ